jgi:TP53 regulating kinase-like protein
MATIEGQNTILLSRGAEAEVYIVDFFGLRAVMKKRISKKYRAKLFDEVFIRNRTRVEARVLSELYEAGLSVPSVLFVDEENGVLIVEYIEGVRASESFEKFDLGKATSISRRIGGFAARMHSLGIYHGDYTLANVLLRESEVYVIDFGLSGYSSDVEEYAIDLHLMARSIKASRPLDAEVLIKAMLDEYGSHYRGDYREVLNRMKEISVRGRYIDRELRKSIMRERYIA